MHMSTMGVLYAGQVQHGDSSMDSEVMMNAFPYR
jgi:hypothetical protein